MSTRRRRLIRGARETWPFTPPAEVWPEVPPEVTADYVKRARGSATLRALRDEARRLARTDKDAALALEWRCKLIEMGLYDVLVDPWAWRHAAGVGRVVDAAGAVLGPVGGVVQKGKDALMLARAAKAMRSIATDLRRASLPEPGIKLYALLATTDLLKHAGTLERLLAPVQQGRPTSRRLIYALERLLRRDEKLPTRERRELIARLANELRVPPPKRRVGLRRRRSELVAVGTRPRPVDWTAADVRHDVEKAEQPGRADPLAPIRGVIFEVSEAALRSVSGQPTGLQWTDGQADAPVPATEYLTLWRAGLLAGVRAFLLDDGATHTAWFVPPLAKRE